MSCRDRKRIHLDKCLPSFCFLRMTWHKKRQLVICSPSRHSSMAATALGSATAVILHLHGGAGPQQQRDHLDVAVLCRPMQWRPTSAGRGGYDARPTHAPRGQGVSERGGKLASCASLKSHSPTQTLQISARHLTKECQEK